MADQIPFQLIVNVPSRIEMLYKGLVLPCGLGNVLSQDCKHITLVVYDGRQYRVCIKALGDGLLRLKGGGLIYFVNNDANIDFKRLCFKLIENDVFEVQKYDDQGLENRYGTPFSCLVEIDESTFYKQDLNPDFLGELNGNGDRSPSRTVRIIGSQQDGTVKVYRDPNGNARCE